MDSVEEFAGYEEAAIPLIASAVLPPPAGHPPVSLILQCFIDP